jgi:hypothetical protein
MLPARVTLSLYFFQETRDKKKLVASLLKLHSYHDPRPEGRTTKDGKTLIEPKDLSPPACCIIQRHPTKCSEIYIDDNGKEKTMQIPSDLGVPGRCLHFLGWTRVHRTMPGVVSFLRKRPFGPRRDRDRRSSRASVRIGTHRLL